MHKVFNFNYDPNNSSETQTAGLSTGFIESSIWPFGSEYETFKVISTEIQSAFMA